MVKDEPIHVDAAVMQKPGLIAADMDGEKVMMDIESGKYFGLDPIGSCIWNMMETKCSLRDMVAQLQQEFDVDEQTCTKDVINFLTALYGRGLIELV
ncbi:MAG TPA: lasso peptide biosynthesis PqqD family chaperone [Patescibacteria group bacterium]|nr:lasso peptide biosynthesis PqqD family chaperone [Patescibacteria group bacterium]